jgi:hypothetical protein
MQYTKKLVSVSEISKPFKLESFSLLKDMEGWTDSYMADLTNYNLENMKAKAFLLKDKLERYVIDREKTPEIKTRIYDGGYEVTDLKWDLENNWLVLIATDTDFKVSINSKYIKYFTEAYKNVGGIQKMIIRDNRSPVKIYGGDDLLIGLVSPILT